MAMITVGVPGASEVVGAANLANGQGVAGVASSALVASRATRRSVSIRNLHATDSVWLGTGTVTAGNGFLLKAGESIPFYTTAAINGLRLGSNDVTICYLEEYD